MKADFLFAGLIAPVGPPLNLTLVVTLIVLHSGVVTRS